MRPFGDESEGGSRRESSSVVPGEVAASCAPARASLFTGLYPQTTGILKNADRWTRSWIEGINQAGYHCTNIGKMHTWPFETPLGFDQRFVVENKGNLVHEFNVGTPDMHEAHQEEMMMMVEHGVIQGGKLNHDMMNMDMGNGHSMKHDDPNSVLLEPGQSKEVVWKFSDKGNIEFACNVPGHYQAGMYGEVNFE